jgi:putative tryptophan/tyrosine transport system substrate-binding protein
MRRRAFLAGSVAVAAVAPRAAAQPTRAVARVGFLSGTAVPDLFEVLREGLREAGWVAGQNIAFEQRYGDGRFDRIPELAADLVRRKVDVVVISATALGYVKQATGDIPIVFVIADDPVVAGHVRSLARPGGRMTGLTSLNVDLDGKRLEMLKAALPAVSRVAVLATPHDSARGERLAAIERVAPAMGLHTTLLNVSTAARLEDAFDGASRARVGAVMVLGSPLFRTYQSQMAELGRSKRLPIVSAWRELPAAGGLMSYGTSVSAMFRRAASYVDRILKGTSPGDLPVERATIFELVVNLRSARALGLTIPEALLLRADQVIN